MFNKPFDPAQINLYDTSGTFGPDDVLLTGPSSPQTSIHGSLIIDPNNKTITFVKTSTFTTAVNSFNPQTGVLTAGTYTVTFRSASNGFKDLLGAPLDGTASGNPAGSNYTTTFVVAATPTQVVGIPGFARGPNSAQTINLPNTVTTGIPLNLADGTGVTSGKFTLQYNSALLTITGASVNTGLTGATMSLDGTSTPGSAIFDFSSPTALATGAVRLGSLVATVPNSAAALYKSKALLHFSSMQINGSSTGIVGDDAVEVVGYFGDATGDGSLSGGDASLISRVATGVDNNPATGVIGGFSAYQLADPALIGDLNTSGSVDASDVTLMNSFLSGTPRPQIPAIPAGLTILPAGPDPSLSLPTNVLATPGDTVVVPVNIDTARPDGSTGMTEAILAVQFDPAVFTVSAQDVELGSLPTSGSGWRLQTAVNATTGEIGIDLFSTTPIQTSAGGSLVTLALHVRDSRTGRFDRSEPGDGREPDWPTHLPDDGVRHPGRLGAQFRSDAPGRDAGSPRFGHGGRCPVRRRAIHCPSKRDQCPGSCGAINYPATNRGRGSRRQCLAAEIDESRFWQPRTDDAAGTVQHHGPTRRDPDLGAGRPIGGRRRRPRSVAEDRPGPTRLGARRHDGVPWPGSESRPALAGRRCVGWAGTPRYGV